MSARGGLSDDAMQECWSGGDGFAVVIGIGDATEDGPPVVDEGNDACGDLGDGEGVRGESAPAPVIFYFIENIFGIRAITIPLHDGRYFFSERGYQDLVFVSVIDEVRFAGVDDHLFRLLGCGKILRSQIARSGRDTTQDHHASSTTPRGQLQR